MSKEENWVYLIKQGCISGNVKYLDTAYLDENVAILCSKELDEEWCTNTVEHHSGEFIDDNRVIVGNKVYKLHEITLREKLREVAKTKLSKEELEALLS